MSDLIDFNSPNPNKGLLLASPLIPAPETSKSEDGVSPSEAGSHFLDKRLSLDNNPFDMVMKKINEYERNKEDPFETITEKAMDFGRRASRESKNDLFRSSTVPKLNNTSSMYKLINCDNKDVCQMNVSTKNDVEDLSILNNSAMNDSLMDYNDFLIPKNLSSDRQLMSINKLRIGTSGVDNNVNSGQLSCDNKKIPSINISPRSDNLDLSILNSSDMNDSLLEDSNKDVKLLSTDLSARPRAMSQNNVFPKNVQQTKKRSLSVNDTKKDQGFVEPSSLGSAHSSLFDDPLNKAFRTFSIRSNPSSSFNGFSSLSSFNTQFDMSTNKLKMGRLNSESSTFSGLTNISSISTDSIMKTKLERFNSECSAISGISQLSSIQSSQSNSSYDSSVFLSDNANEAFIASRSQLSSASSNAVEKTPLKSDKSDLIKKFYEIKTRMSGSKVKPTKLENSVETQAEKNKFNTNIVQNEEKLVDIDTSVNSVPRDDVNDIIFHEAMAIAQTIEKMPTKGSTSDNDEDLFFSKTQLNFDDLPPSDDEAVDNLIDLPPSPVRNTSSTDDNKCTDNKSKSSTPKDDIKALENEFIEQKDVNKKEVAAALLLDLKKIIKEENNPDACKVLDDLQKLLGVGSYSNTEILQACLQNTNNPSDENSDFKENVPDNKQMSISNEDIVTDNKEDSDIFEKVSESKKIVYCNGNSELKTIPESKESTLINKIKKNESRNGKGSLESVENLDISTEDQKLAVNLIRTLNKILTKNTTDSTTDVLKNLGTVLNAATEIKTKCKDQFNNTKVVKNSEKKMTSKLNRSASSIYKSPGRQSLGVKSQNKSFEALTKRRSVSTNPVHSNNNLLEVSAKEKQRSQLLAIRKRFPSDPGFVDRVSEKKSKSPEIKQQSSQSHSNLATSKVAMEPIKTKLRKKQNSEIVSKKGPLKAMIPLGNMQKTSTSESTCGLVTPPKAESVPVIKIISSTPNSNSNITMSKLVSSSTPRSEAPKIRNIKAQMPHKVSVNLSTESCNLRRSLSCPKTNSKNLNHRSEGTLSPQKRPSTPRKNSENDKESRLSKYSPRPVRVRNYSTTYLKTAKSPPNTTGPGKISTDKKTQRQSVLSPLKNSNKLVNKSKSMSLMTKLGRSNSIQTGPEKENYA